MKKNEDKDVYQLSLYELSLKLLVSFLIDRIVGTKLISELSLFHVLTLRNADDYWP